MVNILEIAKLQEDYAALARGKKLSKKAICDICVPFRDKAGLTDSQTLQIARCELSLTDILRLCGIDKLYADIDTAHFMEAMSVLNYFRNCHYTEAYGTEDKELADAIDLVLPIFARLIAREERR